MPYEWKTSPTARTQELRLWPHQSLPPKGFAAFILTTFTLILIPTLPLLGTPWGMYFALQGNYKSRQIEEVFTLTDDTVHLTHTTPKGDVKEWDCNRYWTVVTKYEKDGPVPHYVTLRGKGREVEIGKFLSEDERIALFDELNRSLLRGA